MKIQVWSKTKIGKWASVLTVLFIVLMVLKLTVLSRILQLPLPTPIIAVLGIIGFILAIISTLKNKDRSIFVLLSIPIGILIIIVAVAEIMFPH